MRYHFAKLCLLLAICLFAALSPQGYFEAQASDGPRNTQIGRAHV